MRVRKTNKLELKKKPAQFSANKDLHDMSYENAPLFIKRKIEKGRKMIAIAGLPKQK